jgi:superfamily I DNA/RNA helicase
MPSFEVGRDAPTLAADARQVIGDAVRFVGRLEEAGGVVTIDEFSAPRLTPTELSPHGGGPAELAVLLASGGLALFWADDSPVYELRRLNDACRLLEQVGAALDAEGATLHLRVSPDISDVAREIVEAALGRRLESAGSGSGSSFSTLPGLDQLDDQQRAAVLAPLDRDLLINAGAGSGKTHTLAFRIAHLVSDCGLRADRCIALTFSRAARSQIESRLRLLATEGYPALAHVEVQTLHALCRRLLHLAADHGLGRLRRGFRIAGTVEERSEQGVVLNPPAPFVLAYDVIFEGIDDGRSRAERLTLYPLALSMLRNGHPDFGLLVRPDEVGDKPITVASPRNGRFEDLRPEHVRAIWVRYQRYLDDHNEIDLDGLIPEAFAALRDHEALLRLVAGAYDIAFVDEYQDTTRSQDRLLLLLAGAGVRLNVVGDGDQTINTFAGAYAENITRFRERLRAELSRDALIYPLETNYRSRPEIVALASSVISNNRNRLGKVMRPAQGGSSESGHVQRVDGELKYIAPWVGLKIRSMLEGGVSASSIAIVYRKEGAASPQMSSVRDYLNSVQVPIALDDDEDGVRLRTIHRAKGLEFDHVFVLYLRPGDFPDRRGDLEEERRLLYVAVTRAASTVYVCGKSGGEPDLFLETDVQDAHPTTHLVQSLNDVLAAPDLAELRRVIDETDINDWDEPIN